ncbi:MAG: DUF2059 domain-containing protein [Candidatus Firestonebacteria bacterium]
MKRFGLMLAAVTVLISGASYCAEEIAAPAKKETNTDQAARYKDIRSLLEAIGGGGMGEDVAGQIVRAFKQQFPAVTDAEWKAHIKNMNTAELDEKLLPVYDKYLANADVKEITAFYNSEIGKKMKNTMPVLMQESMGAGQTWGDEKAEALMKLLTAQKEEKDKKEKKEEVKEKK